MHWEYFTETSFIIVLLGTMLIGIAASFVGVINVMKGQSLIGDAIGHATFPGIVIVFMIFATRNVFYLMFGAVVAGGLAFVSIVLLSKYTVVKSDAAMAIVLSGFFGIGIALKSYIQSQPGATQAQLQTYIFGQAAFMKNSELQAIFIVTLLVIMLFIIFYKEIQLYIFDPIYAEVCGFKPSIISSICLLMTLMLIATGIKAVGAILISSILIAPVISARQWCNRFLPVSLLAAFFSGTSAVMGTYVSRAYEGFSTGPSIVLFLSLWAFISILFSPKGLIVKIFIRSKNRNLLLSRVKDQCISETKSQEDSLVCMK